jgi:hypothetical protein
VQNFRLKLLSPPRGEESFHLLKDDGDGVNDQLKKSAEVPCPNLEQERRTPITSGAFPSARLIDSFFDVLDHQTAKILLISTAGLPCCRGRLQVKSVSERVAGGV